MEYHFKVEPELKRKLNNLALKEKVGLSVLINSIIEKSFRLLEYFDLKNYFGNQEETKINGEKLTEDIWCCTEVVYKNKLFAIQHHYCFHSKAKILRFLLRRYLEWLEKRGKKELKRFVGWFQKRWRAIRNNKKYWNKITLCKSAYFTEIYNENYELSQIIIS